MDQGEDHQLGALLLQSAFGAHGSVTDRGEDALDGVRTAQVVPMFAREVVEGHERIAVLRQGAWIFDRFCSRAAPQVAQRSVVNVS